MREERPPLVHIHYLRPPDREQIYTQYLISEEGGVKVTYAHDLKFESPIRIAGAVVLETGSEVIWFTFPGAWHDIGIFHRADGSVTGPYANILTPCVFEDGGIWRTTDLFLDLWIDPTGRLLKRGGPQLAAAARAVWRSRFRSSSGKGSWAVSRSSDQKRCAGGGIEPALSA